MKFEFEQNWSDDFSLNLIIEYPQWYNTDSKPYQIEVKERQTNITSIKLFFLKISPSHFFRISFPFSSHQPEYIPWKCRAEGGTPASWQSAGVGASICPRSVAVEKWPAYTAGGSGRNGGCPARSRCTRTRPVACAVPPSAASPGPIPVELPRWRPSVLAHFRSHPHWAPRSPVSPALEDDRERRRAEPFDGVTTPSAENAGTIIKVKYNSLRIKSTMKYW